ncbi:GNAT family N-acetyltransferase [Marinimicrobium alkaliphilum]|uniref:GNAT family N-acetyltransferase n=1 Tax=Marinimicrobium alkaliphilum TaxID=2202654 RepID=UPI000DB92CF5|nr:GNAT family N-acetyltransferase [Marinimicrobium alkaliphilum]
MEIRLTSKEDAAILAEYFSANREHFQPWEPIREAGYHSSESLTKRLVEYEEQHENGSAAHFVGLINGQVVSHCSLTNVVYGPLQGCFMGYGVSKEHEGTGVMAKVCQVAIEYAFKELDLNRIMANYMPVNTRSADLLNRLGFSQEGLARKYLKINGVWEDHVLTSKLNPENS